MKKAILAIGLLCAAPTLGTDILPTSEENIHPPSKAARFQKTFPELTEGQREIFGPFSLYFGVELSELENIKTPDLETKITEESDENTLFFLQVKKESYEKKVSEYRALEAALDNLPRLYTFFLNEIELQSHLHFTTTHHCDDQALRLFSFYMDNEGLDSNETQTIQRLKESNLEETVIALNQLSRYSYKAMRDYKKSFLKDYQSTEILIPMLMNVFSKTSQEGLTPDAELQLIKKIQAERAKTLREKCNIKIKKQEQLRLIFTLIDEYFLNPLQQFKNMCSPYPQITDEEFDAKLLELRANSEKN